MNVLVWWRKTGLLYCSSDARKTVLHFDETIIAHHVQREMCLLTQFLTTLHRDSFYSFTEDLCIDPFIHCPVISHTAPGIPIILLLPGHVPHIPVPSP
jgi:hypothetical protein